MHRLTTILAVFVATLALSAIPFEDAEAKRFGFGKSMGKQYNSSRSTKPQNPSTAPSGQQAAGQAGARTSGASRWLGPLAGLAAGGLLASLFFGDAFEGLQMLDFLLIAGLLFGGVALFRAMRSRASPRVGTAGGPDVANFSGPDAGFGPGEPKRASGGVPVNAGPEFEVPSWFDETGFVTGAKTHFIRLQAAWDKADLKDISEYTTPELFAELQAERLSRGEERHFTEVVSLDTELLGLQRDGDRLVASIRFSGLIKEDVEGRPQDFSEVWHVLHDWETSEGDWLIGGIQQS